MAKRRFVSRTTRFEVFKRDSFTCQYCGRSAPDIVLHLDHIHPVSKDGQDEVTNYITACLECNLGKSDRLLSDDSVVVKQKKILDQLQERREQIAMMMQWREGLRRLDKDVVEVAVKAFNDQTPGWSISDQGRASLKKLLKKFELTAVLDAIEQSAVYLQPKKDGSVTGDSVRTAFAKLGGICRLNQQPEWKRELYYIRGILRNKCPNYFNDQKALTYLENAYDDGVSLGELREVAYSTRNWSNFMDRIVAVRRKAHGTS